MRINRRQALSLFAAPAAAGPAMAQPSRAVPARFDHGVASGDPHADGVLIWTRATPLDGKSDVPLRWMVAEDAGFAHVVASGGIAASGVRDHCAKVEVAGLKPGHEYWYRFQAGGVASPAGRAKTLPAGPVEEVVLAFTTCALFPAGFFNAYHHMAQAERLDAVVELGDYIYEYGAEHGAYGMDAGEKIGRIPEPRHDLLTLDDYRARYAQYRRDPDLQAAHHRAPWICVWDDHEVANDTWQGGAENHHEKTEGPFDLRKAAALRAWYEWMPVRDPVPGRAFEAINRSFDFGDLASLTMLESRLTARSYQLEYDRPGDIPFVLYDARDPEHRARVADPTVVAEVRARTPEGAAPPAPYLMGPDTEAVETYVADPRRQMLGEAQEAWLARTLKASVVSGKPWQVIGNEVIMARCRSPNLYRAVGAEKIGALLASLSGPTRERAESFITAMSFDQPFDLDGWDGYPAARARFDDIVAGLDGGNVFVFSGDSHAFWANELHDQAGARRLAAEIGVSSVTSPSIADGGGGFQLGDVLRAQNREVIFCDQLAKGYVRLTLRRDAAVAEMIQAPITRPPYEAKVLAAWRLTPTPGVGVGELQKV